MAERAALDVDGVLRERFGLDAFRPGQQRVIDALLAGRNAAAVFPTGGGKSLCYQLPALLFEGVTVVVSPLIALMKDQCDQLAARGISAARIDGSVSPRELGAILKRVRAGETKLLYLAPERFFNERFRAAVEGLPISLFAVDEAHCISQWGHNFRPDYLKLSEVARQLGAERVLALTATATPEVLDDIRRVFDVRAEDAVRTPFFRANLSLRVCGTSDAERDALLLRRLRERPAGPTVVYVTLQRTAERVAEMLAGAGLPARFYHAGLERDQRTEVQQWFLQASDGIVVATIAFGMGIDKSDIRYVYHYNPSKSLEAYAQEVGRAGRDGEGSICETFVVPEDRIALENFAYGDTPEPRGVERLMELVAGQPETFHMSHLRWSNETDVKVLVVRTLMTYLELEGWLQGIAPRYDTYEFQPHVDSASILSHFEGERRQLISGLLSCATKGRQWFKLPMGIAVRRLQEPRERLVKALDYLAERGWLTVRARDLVYGYRRLKPIDRPSALAEEYYQRLLRREANEVRRVEQVMSMLEGNQCLSWRLSDHFGEQLDAACGVCSVCEGNAVSVAEVPATGGIGRAATAALERVCREHPEALATPRQQARFLCGLTSPAFTRARLSREPDFGSCAALPFGRVLEICQQRDGA